MMLAYVVLIILAMFFGVWGVLAPGYPERLILLSVCTGLVFTAVKAEPRKDS